MPTGTAKKITYWANGIFHEVHTTGGIDDTSHPGEERFQGRRILPAPAETADGAMFIVDANVTDKKVEDLVA